MRVRIVIIILLFAFITGCDYRIEQCVFVVDGTTIEDCDKIVYQVETRIINRGEGFRVHTIVDSRLDEEEIQVTKQRQYKKAEKLIECLKQKQN